MSEKELSVTTPEGLEKTLEKVKPDVNKAFERAEKHDQIERHVRVASLEMIQHRRERQYPFDILVDVVRDDEGHVVSKEFAHFVAKRPTDKERTQFIDLNNKELALLSDKEMEVVNQQFYVFLSKVVLEPVWTPEQWGSVDQALLKQVMMRLIYLANTANDGQVFDFFTKLSS